MLFTLRVTKYCKISETGELVVSRARVLLLLMMLIDDGNGDDIIIKLLYQQQ